MTSIRAQEQALRTRYGTTSWRNVRPQRCRTCKTWTLVGLDASECAHRAIVDPAPLNPVGEALARILGLATYDLARVGNGSRLTRRNRHLIARSPAGDPRNGQHVDVVAEHACTRPQLPTAPTHIPDPIQIPTEPVEQTCPF